MCKDIQSLGRYKREKIYSSITINWGNEIEELHYNYGKWMNKREIKLKKREIILKKMKDEK